jgi:hypothetical protein
MTTSVLLHYKLTGNTVAGPSPGDLSASASPGQRIHAGDQVPAQERFHVRRTAQRPDRGEMTGLGSTREGLGITQPPWDG